MTTLDQNIQILPKKLQSNLWVIIQSLLGSIFLFACAQISVPLYPVPMTMQTFGIFFLAMTQGGSKAALSTLFYIAFASLGLPVLAGWQNGLCWWLSPTAGYIIAFPVAAFIIGKMFYIYKNPSITWTIFSILVGKIIIYSMGILGLMRLMSFEQSITVGLVPFLPVAVLKIVLVTSFYSLWLRFKKDNRV